MGSNDLRQPPQAEQPCMDGVAGDWRRQVQMDLRQRMLNRIIDTLSRCLPSSDQEGLHKLQKSAIRFEEKVYVAATNSNDYIRRISLKMLDLESKINSIKPNAMPSNYAGMRNPQHPVNQNMQSEVQNQDQSLSVPMAPNQASALPPVNSLAQHSVPGNSKMQNSVQGVESNHTNPLRQQIQQSQNQEQYINQQWQLQQQILKQKLHEGGIQLPLKQPHMQQQSQQNMLKPARLQSSHQSLVQNSPLMQPSMVSVLQQGLPSSSKQHNQQSIPEQHPHKHPQQDAVVHHQTEIFQQPLLQCQQQHEQQQQNLTGQQRIGQHASISYIQQQQPQRLLGQGNNISSMSGSSCMQTNQELVQIMQQPKVYAQQQRPNASTFLGNQEQHSPQQEMVLLMPSQMAQLQEQFVFQQQSSEHNMQEMLQTSNPLRQQLNMIDQQGTLQAQRAPAEAPSTSLDSTQQTGNSSDWKEDVYQKIKVLKEMYFADLYEMYRRTHIKLQQHEFAPQQPNAVANLRFLKQILECCMHYLQVTKSNMRQCHKDKLESLEKQIVSVLKLRGYRKPGPPILQVQLPPPHMQSLKKPEPEPQITQTQFHDWGMNSQLQSINLRGSSVPVVQPSKVSNLHGSTSSASAITSFQKKMMNSLQSGSDLDLGQGSAPTSDQHVAMGSLQQIPSSASHQVSIRKNAQSNSVSSNISFLQPCSNMLQSQHPKQQQELQIMQQRQQPKEPLQRHHSQQQLHMQQFKQQQPGQLLDASHQMNDLNNLKMRQGMDLKSERFPQNLSQGERHPNKQLKPGFSFSNSSPKVHQATSPKINQHSSQSDQQDLLPPLTEVGTPLQSTNSPSLIPSPSASIAPSPLPGDHEKPNTTVSSLVNASSIIHHKTSLAPSSKSSNALATPGMSASPILADLSPPDSHGNNALNTLSGPGKSGATQQSFKRLLEVVKSMSSKALNASVTDIGSVSSMNDQIAGSAPGNGSRAAVSEDLAAATKCLLQARTSIAPNGSIRMKRMRHYTSSMPLDVSSFVGSLSDSFKQSTGSETSDQESTATSGVKRPRIEIKPALLEEIKGINERLIDTVVDICDEDVGTNLSAAAIEGAEGTFVTCSYNGVSLSPKLKSQYASAQMLPFQPLRLLVPVNYPNCSPILMDKFPLAFSKECDDLSSKARSRFSISLRILSQPMSLMEIARAWDDCTRAVITESAQLSGGGTFSSKYGTLQNYLSFS